MEKASSVSYWGYEGEIGKAQHAEEYPVTENFGITTGNAIRMLTKAAKYDILE